jgi:predicted dehydrogenase
MKKYRWGILSTARIARYAMIPALQQSTMAEVVAVASRDFDKARQFSTDLSIPKAFGNYQNLLDSDEIDAVYIPLPNHMHKEWSIRAAEAGKHILCEKPIAMNAIECREMIASAESNGVELMESFMYRYHPRFKAAKQMATAGEIGELKAITSALTFKMTNEDDYRHNPEMGGGALMDVGCYCVNISRQIAGREPLTVSAYAAWTPKGVDAQIVGILDFGDGLFAHFDCAFNMALRQTFLIAGTDGYLSMDYPVNPPEDQTTMEEIRDREIINTYTFPPVNDYMLIAEDFMRSIETGKPAYPVNDAEANMRVIDALVVSAKNGVKPIDL